jgi:outer membrane receptor protein involved in Fe transport
MNKKSSQAKKSALALAVAMASSGICAATLEEVIVTAQKRTESLQEVPISMTALDGERMQESGVTSYSDLSVHVPNLEIAENAVNTIITMRGIGVGSNQSFEQSVGTYVDGIHYGKSRQIRTGLFDAGQVEVLRGPQGILFGKNTLAGAINVTTTEPVVGEEMHGGISVGVESYDKQTLQGNINAPITDSLAVRFSFRDQEADGYLDNAYQNSVNPTMSTTDESIWRLSTVWEPNEDTSVKLKHTESDYIRLGGASTVTTYSPVENLPEVDQLLYGAMGIAYPNFSDSVSSGEANRDSIAFGGCAMSSKLGHISHCGTDGYEKPEGTDTQTHDTSLNVEIDLDGGYTFTSVTGIAGYEYEDNLDADFLPVRFIGRSDISQYSQKSQEFRIASPADQDFSFVAGAYYNSSEQEIDRLMTVDGTLGLSAPVVQAMTGGTSSGLALTPSDIARASLIAGGIANPTDAQIAATASTSAVLSQVNIEGATMFSHVGRISNWKQDTDSWALFFQGTYQLRDDLSLTAGVRYTEEDKNGYAKMDLTHGSEADGTYNNLAEPSDNAALAGIMGTKFDSWAHEFDEKRSTDQLIPAANLQWDKSDHHKYYISYAEGFKSGGFNSVDDQNPVLNASGTAVVNAYAPGNGFEYEDETASSWEIGGKHTLLDGAMSLNWAYFNSEYDNQQVSTFVGLGFVVTNAASSNISGLEVDLAWQATEQLRLGANLALLDGQYDNFEGAACTAEQASDIRGGASSSGRCTSHDDGSVTQDLSGGQLGAKYSGSITADYEQPLSNGAMWFASADLYFSDSWFLAGDLDPIDEQAAFDRINVRTGLRTESYDLMLFGRNITDEVVGVGAADVPQAAGSHFKYLTPGDVWGATVSYRF